MFIVLKQSRKLETLPLSLQKKLSLKIIFFLVDTIEVYVNNLIFFLILHVSFFLFETDTIDIQLRNYGH